MLGIGQPTNALFSRLGHKQLWLANWVAAPAKQYYLFATRRDWVLHRLVVLFVLYGFILPNSNLWVGRESTNLELTNMRSPDADAQFPVASQLSI
jgi:hypothetical protein